MDPSLDQLIVAVGEVEEVQDLLHFSEWLSHSAVHHVHTRNDRTNWLLPYIILSSCLPYDMFHLSLYIIISEATIVRIGSQKWYTASVGATLSIIVWVGCHSRCSYKRMVFEHILRSQSCVSETTDVFNYQHAVYCITPASCIARDLLSLTLNLVLCCRAKSKRYIWVNE